MAFDLRGMLTSVQAIVAALPTVVSTEAGLYGSIPESFVARLNVIAALGKATPEDSVMGGQEWRPEIYILIAYRVGGAEAEAELVLADVYLELVDAILNNPTLNGTSDPGQTRIDSDEGLRPIFQAVAGSEMRFYPARIVGYQQRYV